ncbi:MAG: HD domain-containing protein [archaeon]
MNINLETAKAYALEKFSQMSQLDYRFNSLHCECMIKAIDELEKDLDTIDIEKLKILVWLHDIGKIINEEDHAKHSFEILEKDFELDEIDKDCILNHAVKDNPITIEGKVFRIIDKISFFYPDMLLYFFYGIGREGKNKFEEAKLFVDKSYNGIITHKSSTVETKLETKARELLIKKYNKIFGE